MSKKCDCCCHQQPQRVVSPYWPYYGPYWYSPTITPYIWCGQGSNTSVASGAGATTVVMFGTGTGSNSTGL